MYEIIEVGGGYAIGGAEGAVLTPGGNPFCTEHAELARLLLADIAEFGPDPAASTSYVTLHASYLDFARQVPRIEFVHNLFTGYRPERDPLLDRPAEPEQRAAHARAFGDIEPGDNVVGAFQAWSLRQLVTAMTCAGTFGSVLLALRVVEGRIALAQIAHGVTYLMGHDKEGEWVAATLERLRRYASFPDE